MKEKIQNIIQKDKQFDEVLNIAFEREGQKRDRLFIEKMKTTSEEDFRKMIADMRGTDEHIDLELEKSLKAKIVSLFENKTSLKVIAACVVAVLLFGVFSKVQLEEDTSNCAALFNQYGKMDNIAKSKLATYEIGDKSAFNYKGHKSSAGMLKESADLICDGNIKETQKGVAELKKLLTLNYKRELAHEIHWYLGLGYLRLNQPTEAKIEFEYVKELKSHHTQDAEVILKKIWDITREQ